MTIPETESNTRRRGYVTPGEMLALVLFLALLVLGYEMRHEWRRKTELLERVVVPVNNWDAVCDDFEIDTARPTDGTPCGQFLKALVEMNSAI